MKFAKKEVLRDTAYGIVNAGQNKCSHLTLNGTWEETFVQFENNKEIGDTKLSDYFKGKIPDAGQVDVSSNCQAAIAIWDDNIKTCAYKGFKDDKVVLIDMKNSNTCKLEGNSGNLDSDYVDTSSTGYKCSNPGEIVATDERFFTFDQTTGTITAYSSEGPKDVVIPCKIGGAEVKMVGKAAFYNKQIVSVIMPDTIKTIGPIAFAQNKITKIELSSGVETINNGAFCNNDLTELVLPDSLKTIESSYTRAMSDCNHSTYTVGAFHGNKLTNVTFGSGIESIGDYTFAGWSSRKNSIANLDISKASKLKYIGKYAFSENSLSEVDFSSSTELSKISEYAFSSNQLIEVNLNKNIELLSIGESAFSSNKLLSLNLLNNKKLNLIGNYAFSYNNITDLKIGGNSLKINNSSFNQNKITSLTIDGQNIQIGDGVFANNLIEDINLKGVISIGSDAFKNNHYQIIKHL